MKYCEIQCFMLISVFCYLHQMSKPIFVTEKGYHFCTLCWVLMQLEEKKIISEGKNRLALQLLLHTGLRFVRPKTMRK